MKDVINCILKVCILKFINEFIWVKNYISVIGKIVVGDLCDLMNLLGIIESIWE